MLKTKPEPLVQIPLSALKCLSSDLKGGKIICEINIMEMKRVNKSRTFDEIISEARLDYAKGDYKSFITSKTLLAYLKN